MSYQFEHPDGSVSVEERNGRRAISVDSQKNVFTPAKKWLTRYPVELIEHVLNVKGPARLCDEIMREEDPSYVERSFKWGILSYMSPGDFAGKRILDFGSGSGSSTMVLGRMFPRTNIVGIELVPEYVSLAQHRARFYGMDSRVSFMLSADASGMPSDIGEFDFVVFSAVYEHLLPAERRALLPMVWSHLKPGGTLFLDQTPFRWFPVEMHTTGLPLINYLPNEWALFCARRFSRRVPRHSSWEQLLRRGIRGGTTPEIVADLTRLGGRAEQLQPTRGVRDDIDLWYRLSSDNRKPLLKKGMMHAFRVIKALTGATMIPQLSLAFRKPL